MFKLLVAFSFVACLAGGAFAAPIASHVSLAARKPTPASATALSALTPCSPLDQGTLAFGGGTSADTNLINCDSVDNPFPCTNIDDGKQTLPLCNTSDTPAAIASVAAAAAAAAASAAAAPPTPGVLAFGGGTSPDTNLINCDSVDKPFPCTNINDGKQTLPQCSTSNTPAAIASVAAAAAAASASAAAAPPTPCSPVDQGTLAFGGGTSPDTNLINCSSVDKPFPCTNISKLVTGDLPLCSTAPGATR
ncbi:hypothetical protein C8R46DRAFT_1220497 [Mycena filopes]|nr:hypothetical protein C8R46DRAFT_1220497 [Mycena filopes]